MQAPPPPNPARDGSVTLSMKPRATAASAADPPAESTWRAASAARGSSATTPPRNPFTNPAWPCAGALPGPNRLLDTLETVPHAEPVSASTSTMPARSRIPLPAMLRCICANIRVVLLGEGAIDAFHGSGNRRATG
jgi:hypothetical protein